jgi:hypothetical protein
MTDMLNEILMYFRLSQSNKLKLIIKYDLPLIIKNLNLAIFKVLNFLSLYFL